MKKFKELSEQKGLMVMAFGRMNPPTIGHLKLCDKVKSVAGSSPYRIYLSQTVGPKDPLPFPKKIAYAKKSFPKHARAIQVDKSVKTFIQAAQKINQEGYTELIMVAGSDRISEFQRLLDRYNGQPDRAGNVVFDFPDGVRVVSSGERDPDSADPTEAISASVMRAAAQSGDFETFKKGTPLKETDAKKMYMDVRKAMGVREERNMGDMTDFETVRDMYLTGKIWNAGDVVEAKGVIGEVVRRGTNYLSLVDEDGKVHKAWLHEIELNETPIGDIMKKIDAITHPKKYNSAMRKYASMMAKDRAKKMTTSSIAGTVAREYDIDSRSLIKYINGLVKKGELPTRLRASYMPTFAESLELQESKPRRVKQDPDIKDSPGTEPAKYYAKDAKGKEMSKATKQARDRHFAKGAAKDDDDPSAYKPAPGDKGAKTKLSKHTKKVRKMFPSLYEAPPDTSDAMKRYKAGKAGFTDIAHLKAKGLIKRADGTKRKSDKYKEEFELDEGKMQDLWQRRNAKSLSVGPFELLRGKSGVHTIKRSGKVIGDFSYDSDADNFVANIKGMRGQFTGNDIDSLFTHLQKVHKESQDEVKALGEKTYYAIATKSSKSKSGWRRVPDTRFDTKQSAERYGNKYHTDRSGSKMYKIVTFNEDVSQDESLWANIHKKRQRIKRGSGERMRKPGEKGAPTPAQMKRAKGEERELNEWGEIEEAAEYQGRKVTLNKPFYTPDGPKKSSVYVKNDKGNVIKVNFGDPNMEIKRDDPERKKSFRARHQCDTNPGPKTKARYWSCKAWE